MKIIGENTLCITSWSLCTMSSRIHYRTSYADSTPSSKLGEGAPLCLMSYGNTLHNLIDLSSRDSITCVLCLRRWQLLERRHKEDEARNL